MSSPAPRRRDRWLARLAHPRLPAVALALALLLLAPSLGFGLRMDDRWLRVFALGDPRYPALGLTPPHRLFDFFTGPARIEELRRVGFLAWFSDLHAEIAFFRPLSSLLHYAEYRWLGEQYWAMHAVSLGAYAALVLLVHRLYRRLLQGDPWLAGLDAARAPSVAPASAVALGLGVWMFALDHTHGLPVGWLSQRNSVLAALFGVLALWLHDRARRDGEVAARWLAPLAVLLALLSAEAGTAAVAALVAYALTLEAPGQRVRSLLPYALPVGAWAVAYKLGGYGARGSGMYLDLLHHPWTDAPRAVLHYVVLLGTEFGNPLADLWVLAPPALQALAVLVSVGLLVGFGLAAAPVLRRSATARFLALASLLTLLPPSLTQPQSRLLLFAGVFELGLLAVVASAWLRGAVTLGRPWRLLAMGVTGYSVAGHLLLSPLMLTSTAEQMRLFERVLGGFTRALPDDPEHRTSVVIANAPNLAFLGYVTMLGPALGRPTPERVLGLASGERDVELTTVDERTLRVKNTGGFARGHIDTLLRSAGSPLRLGERFVMSDATVEIEHVDDEGHADVARFSFRAPVTDPTLVFRRWEGSTLVPLALPPPGGSLRLPAQRLLPVMIDATRGGVDVPGR